MNRWCRMDCGGFSGCMLFTTVETIFFAFKAIELGGVVCFIDFWIEFVGWIIYGTKLSCTWTILCSLQQLVVLKILCSVWRLDVKDMWFEHTLHWAFIGWSGGGNLDIIIKDVSWRARYLGTTKSKQRNWTNRATKNRLYKRLTVLVASRTD